MRQPAEQKFYAKVHQDGDPCVLHAKETWGKAEGLTEITVEQAREISAARRAKEPPPALPTPIMVTESGEEVATQDPEARAEINRLQGELRTATEALQMLADSVADKFAEQQFLNDLRFETVAAENDESPTVAKYPHLKTVLELDESSDGNAEAWQAAIEAYKATEE